MRTTAPPATSFERAVGTVVGSLAPHEQAMRLRSYSGQALFGVQHDRCERANSKGQDRRIHKLCPLLNLPFSRATIVIAHDLVEAPGKKGRLVSVITQRLAFGLAIRKSKIHGRGCFATIPYYENQRIAEYVGERISLAEAERRRCAPGEQCICDVDSDWAIDGSRGGNGTQYVNHSCQPNSYVIVSEKRIFIYALRQITPGEEITTDYLYELYSDQTTCRCRTPRCDETTSLAGSTVASAEANQTPDQHSEHLAAESPRVVVADPK